MSDDTELLDVLASLPRSDNYTDMDRYRDFRKVFTSEEGRRVLREIVSWGRVLSPSVSGSPIDPYLTHIRDGEKNLALRILVAIYKEPSQRPTQVIRKPTLRRDHG